MSWFDLAACAGMGVDLFFPSDGVPSPSVLAVCEGCPVRSDCLAFARDEGIRHGVWGGLSEGDRYRAERRKRGSRAAVCGTTGGYKAHHHVGTPPCDACLAAQREYHAAARERRLRVVS